MTKEQAEYNLKAIEHFANGGSLISYNIAKDKWENELNPSFLVTNNITYIIDDEYVEYRKAIALGGTVEHKYKSTDCWLSLNSKLHPNTTFYNTSDYRVVSKLDFPIYAKSIKYSYYVKFRSEKIYDVIYQDINCRYIKPASTLVTDKSEWEIIEDPYELTDKCLVEAWDNGTVYSTIVFYSVKNKGVLTWIRDCGTVTYDNYKRVPPWLEASWVAEARKKLDS